MKITVTIDTDEREALIEAGSTLLFKRSTLDTDYFLREQIGEWLSAVYNTMEADEDYYKKKYY